MQWYRRGSSGRRSFEIIEAILTVTGNPQSIQFTTQLAHGAVISAMEAYLWDTIAYWVANDENTLRNLVATAIKNPLGKGGFFDQVMVWFTHSPHASCQFSR
jgi:hypothetical protein